MLREMSFDELCEWRDFYELEPFDSPERADFRAGLVASMLYNVNKGKTATAKKPMDFFPSRRPNASKPLTDPAAWNRVVEAMKLNARASREAKD